LKKTKIKDLMTRNIVTMNVNDTVDKIALEMTEKRVGSVFIYDENDFVGLITKRDLLEKVLLDCLNPCEVIAKEIIKKNPIMISKEDFIPNCLKLMYTHKIKRLPVVDLNNDNIVGIITSYDIIAAFNLLELS